MPKLSYAQEVAALEETLAAVRMRADVLHPFVLTVADELAEQIAELKALKHQQQAYAEEGRATTEALQDAMASGMVAARDIRAYAKLVYGRKNGRLAQFGIRLRRRPRRGVHGSMEVAANPAGTGADAPAPARDETRTVHAARANGARIGELAREIGVDVREIRGEARRIGGNAPAIREDAPGIGAAAPPMGALAAEAGAAASADRENARGLRENAPIAGGILQRAPASQAA